MSKEIKYRIFFFILGAIIFSSASVFAYSLLANNIGFTPKDSSWEVKNTKEALDDLHNSCVYCNEKMIGTEWNFHEANEEDIFVTPCKGRYKLEVWGAQGGTYHSTYHGGYGAYSVGELVLKSYDKLFINVGGLGECMYAGKGSGNPIAGGYNGGGGASGCTSHNDTSYTCAGGGATSIAKRSGLLKTFENDLNNLLIVASGGGGGFYLWNGQLHSIGGSGGGIEGSKFTNNADDISITEVVLPNQNTRSKITANGETHYASFGEGAVVCSGGGGGLYGGSSWENTLGGSSYIGNSLISNKHMACYNCRESDDVDTKTNTTTNVSNVPTSDYAKTGSGYAKITLISLE